MSDNRRFASRERSFARILVSVEGKLGYIADVSEGGFKALFTEAFSLDLGRTFTVSVSFDEIGLPLFEVSALSRWCRISGGCLEVGFELARGSAGPEALASFGKIRAYYAEVDPPST